MEQGHKDKVKNRMEDVKAEWARWAALTGDWTTSAEIDWLESLLNPLNIQAQDDGKQVCVIDQLEVGGRKRTETQGILGNGVHNKTFVVKFVHAR